MRKIKIKNTNKLNINDSYDGETIENKIRRIMSNREPIDDSAPLTYTERKEGIRPEFDIRTDRFDIAIEAMDKVNMSIRAKRDAKPTEVETEGNKKPTDPQPEGAA